MFNISLPPTNIQLLDAFFVPVHLTEKQTDCSSLIKEKKKTVANNFAMPIKVRLKQSARSISHYLDFCVLSKVIAKSAFPLSDLVDIYKKLKKCAMKS
jgi:hypothetical protein